MKSLKEALVHKHIDRYITSEMDAQTAVNFISDKYHNMLKTIDCPYPFTVFHIDNIDALNTHVEDFASCDYTDADKYREDTSLVGSIVDKPSIIIDAFLDCVHHITGKEYDMWVESHMEGIIYDVIRKLSGKYKSLNIPTLNKTYHIDSGGDSVKFITIPFILSELTKSNIDWYLSNIKEFLIDFMKECVARFKRIPQIKKAINL